MQDTLNQLYSKVGLPNQQLNAGLYVTATPIGNLADITLRALYLLSKADLILCEDTRVTNKLLQSYGIKNELLSYNDHSNQGKRNIVVERIAAGQIIALVSDAGTPLISDPGYKLVRQVIDAKQTVYTIPGANAAVAALACAGLPTDKFIFAGFTDKHSELERLLSYNLPVIIYEAPTRVAKLLKRLPDNCNIVIARELTKLHEQILRGTPAEVLAGLEHQKGEFVVIIQQDKVQISDELLRNELNELLKTHRLKAASQILADKYGVSKKYVYGLGVG